MQTLSKRLTLWKNDPLLRFFQEKLRLSGLLTTLILTALVTVAVFGLGWVADRSYTGSGIRFTEPQFYLQILVFVVFGQLIWIGFYTWQPGATARMFQSLEQSGVILSVSERGSQHVRSFSDFLRQFQATTESARWTVISAAFAIGVGIFEALIAMPVSLLASGRSAFWYDVKWFAAIMLLTLLMWQYVVCQIAVKLLQTIVYLNRLFQWFNLRIRPLHPDEAGGLGALGNFTLTTSLMIVAAGIAAAVFSAIDWLNGSNPLTHPDVILFWGLYILGTPVSVVAPMLSAHRAMQAIRKEKLNEIAQEFEKTMSDAGVTRTGDAEAIKKANERLQELQTRYNLVAESLPTWPIPARLFRNFSITASLPLLSGLASVVIDFATK